MWISFKMEFTTEAQPQQNTPLQKDEKFKEQRDMRYFRLLHEGRGSFFRFQLRKASHLALIGCHPGATKEAQEADAGRALLYGCHQSATRLHDIGTSHG